MHAPTIFTGGNVFVNNLFDKIQGTLGSFV
jgi:hypothetical protein